MVKILTLRLDQNFEAEVWSTCEMIVTFVRALNPWISCAFKNIQVQAQIEICIETQHSEVKKSVLQRQVSSKTYPDVLVEGGGS